MSSTETNTSGDTMHINEQDVTCFDCNQCVDIDECRKRQHEHMDVISKDSQLYDLCYWSYLCRECFNQRIADITVEKTRYSSLSNENVYQWLKTNLIVSQSNPTILQKCFNEKFIELFGGYKSLFKIINTNCELNDIQIIYNIIFKQKQSDDSNNITSHIQLINNFVASLGELTPMRIQKTEKMCKMIFQRQNNINLNKLQNIYKNTRGIQWILSNECISYIIDYLSQKDIVSFAQTSTKMTVICMDNMSPDHKLCYWLKLNRLINHSSSNILTKCLDNIICTFGGYKKFLFRVITVINSNQNLLEKLEKIILRQKQMCECVISDDLKHVSEFELLPNEMIYHCCGYLNRIDIFWFKLTSRRIGMICLKEMNKILVEISNTNTLSTVYHRFAADMSVLDLQERMSKQFNIPIKYQLCFFESSIWKSNINFVDSRNTLIWSGGTLQQFDIELYPTSSTMSTLNYKLSTLNYFNRDKLDLHSFGTGQSGLNLNINLKDYDLLIFKYCDITHQDQDIIPYIQIVKPKTEPINDTILSDYIEHKFIGNETFDELKKNLRLMQDDKECGKLYGLSTELLYTGFSVPMHVALKWKVYGFLLNPKHPSYFKTTIGINIQLELKSMGFNDSLIKQAITIYQNNQSMGGVREYLNSRSKISEIIVSLQNENV
eukprot:472033_1